MNLIGRLYMGSSKSEIFTDEQNELALFAKVLAHPARIAILTYLFKQHTCVCGDLVEEIGLAQATISQHLKELKRMGLIKGRIEGRNQCYCIDDQQLTHVKAKLTQFLSQNKSSINQCF